MLPPAIEPEVETPDERQYAELSAKITVLDLKVAAAQEKLSRYAFEHPLRVPTVRERMIQLQEELDALQSERQRLILPWCESKSRVNGW